MALELLFAFILLVITTSILLLVTMPLVGALIRFRANYTPKGLQLDGEGGLQPHVGPVVNSYFGMLLRVKRIEGWSGLYKGLMPSLITTAIVGLFAAIYVGQTPKSPTGRYAMPATGTFKLVVFAIFFAIFTVPMTIITNRTITTPHRLPTFSPVYSIKLLLTPYERSRPWVLFLTPGLIASLVLHIFYVAIIIHTFRRILVPSSLVSDWWMDDAGAPTWPKDFTTIRILSYLSIVALSTVVLCPLEVVSTRLSLQRNHAPQGGFSAVSQEDTHALGVEDPEFAGEEEDVIGLRSEEDPYTGLADCVKRILAEEGKRTLFRGWWITLLAGLLSSFS